MTTKSLARVTDQLDNVIRLVNSHEQNICQTQQVLQETQQTVDQLRQTVETWNEPYDHDQEHEQQVEQSELGNAGHNQQGQVEELNEIVRGDVSTMTSSQIHPPPGLHSSDSGLGSASTIIMSTPEMPLLKGSKRVFVRDATLFTVRKYIVVGRWFVTQIVGRGSVLTDEPLPQDYIMGPSVRTIGPDDQWTTDDAGRMLLNGIPTNQFADKLPEVAKKLNPFLLLSQLQVFQ